MPWQGVSTVDLRVQFISEYLSGLWTTTDLALQYAISRKTAYKWMERYQAGGPGALEDRSRRPHRTPTAMAPAVEKAVVAVRQRHPRWGPRKVLAYLHRRHRTTAWPCASAVSTLFHRTGLVTPRRRRAAVPHGRHELTVPSQPNAVWTTDYKGKFRMGDGCYCHPLTLRDGFSRYVLACDGLLTPTTSATRACFERAFATYGLPERIRSDNGAPFAGPGLARLSRLNVWWMRLGIIPERIGLGRPDQNGSHEQFHRELKAETARPPAAELRGQQRRFRRFCHSYNTERPHEALDNQPPAQYYVPSPRPFPAQLPPVTYPGHFEVRRVSRPGQISWRGHFVFLTEVLIGEDVGLEEVDDGLWTLYFGTVRLARFDERTHTLLDLPPISATG